MGNETLTQEDIEALVYILDNLSHYEYSLDYIDTSLIFTKKQLPTSDDIVKGQTFINLQVLVDAIKEFKEAALGYKKALKEFDPTAGLTQQASEKLSNLLLRMSSIMKELKAYIKELENQGYNELACKSYIITSDFTC